MPSILVDAIHRTLLWMLREGLVKGILFAAILSVCHFL